MEPTRPPPPLRARPELPAHLEGLGLLQRGGMGEVWRVFDRTLGRELALKVGHADVMRDPALRRRFENEARITARLDHPGVVPVHEAGLLPDGRPFFTMRTVRGATFGELLVKRRPHLPRLVEIFERVCLIVSYAHEQGVVHGDLKPDNVIVGAFGEVLVLDWGIARLVTEEEPDEGEILGTPGYMAPEQAEGEPIHRASDVYALGAILYHVVGGGSPHPDGRSRAPEPLARRAALAGLPAPEPLVALCAAAMAEDPAARPGAAAFAEALGAWRDRSRRREEAEEIVAAALPLAREAEASRLQAATLADAAEALLAPLGPDAPEARRVPAWELLERAAGLRTDAEIREARFVEGLQAALRVDDALDAARDLLADRSRDQLVAAEARGDAAAAARARVSLEAHARGARRAWLDAPGRFSLDSVPTGATVHAWRHERRFGRSERVDAGVIGVTPLREHPLPPGSWRLTLTAEGCAPAFLPVVARRAEAEDLGAVPLLATCPPGDCYVPAGWFAGGGDPDAPDAIPARSLWVDGFVMRRHPVTNAEYVTFLDDLVARGDEAGALAAQPVQTDGRGADGVPIFGRAASGRFLLGAAADGIPWAPEWPVCLVSWHAARAYAAWEAARTGLPWRLPDEWEWEKAARGVDGRRYPWGERLDPTWACTQLSHGERPMRASVHAFPADESPYGVRGLGGNVRDWCLNAYGRGPDGDHIRVGASGTDARWRMTRGGAWNSAAAYCLAAGRYALAPDRTATTVGVRLVRGLPAPTGTSTRSPS